MQMYHLLWKHWFWALPPPPPFLSGPCRCPSSPASYYFLNYLPNCWICHPYLRQQVVTCFSRMRWPKSKMALSHGALFITQTSSVSHSVFSLELLFIYNWWTTARVARTVTLSDWRVPSQRLSPGGDPHKASVQKFLIFPATFTGYLS